jgi:hypothetical protein
MILKSKLDFQKCNLSGIAASTLPRYVSDAESAFGKSSSLTKQMVSVSPIKRECNKLINFSGGSDSPRSSQLPRRKRLRSQSSAHFAINEDNEAIFGDFKVSDNSLKSEPFIQPES